MFRNSFLKPCIAFLTTFTVLLACQSAHAQSKKDTLIVFAGTGYLDEKVQPNLEKLLFEPRGAFADAGEVLLDTSASIVNDTIKQSTFSKWSRYPVVTSSSSLDEVLSRRLGRTASAEDRANLFEIFDGVYGIMLIGSLEVQAFEQTMLSLSDADQEYNHWAIVGVSAVLFNLNTGEMNLNATGVGVSQTVQSFSSELDDTSLAAMNSDAYAEACEKALQSLAKLVRKISIKESQKNQSFQRYVVTDTWVVDETNDVHQLFGRQRLSKRTGDACTASEACKEGDVDCLQLSSLLAHSMTAALGKAGFRADPPFGWATWREGAAPQLTARMHLPAYSNAPVAIQALVISPRPELADVKVMPLLWNAFPTQEVSKKGFSEKRGWTAEIGFQVFQTESFDCSNIVYQSDVVIYEGHSNTMGGPIGRPPNDPSLDRLMIMLAIKNGYDFTVSENLREDLVD